MGRSRTGGRFRIIILDSNFLIHLERERRRRVPGPASEFLLANKNTPLVITPTIAGKIGCGESMTDRVLWEKFIGFLPCLEITCEVSWQYDQVFRHLKKREQMIDQNDLWIAATGLAHKRAVVTRNISEFSRVTGLEVMGF